MTDRALVQRMTAYMKWADDVMLNNAGLLPEAELAAPRDTLFTTISGTFDHILVVEEIFRAHLEGHSHGFTARRRPEPLPFAEVARRLRAMDDHYVGLAGQWGDAELEEVVRFTFVGGGEGAMTRQDILLHLVNHATYHRGFVSTLLYPLLNRANLEMAGTDLTVFLRDAWPRAEAA